MVAQVNLATASLGLLVLDATNRKPAALVAVVQVRTDVVVAQAHVVREVDIVLCRTPEVRVVAFVVVTPIVDPEASRQRRKRVGIRAIPASCRFEFCSRCNGTTDSSEQSLKLCFCRQMPACRASRFRSSPCVKATVLGAVGWSVAVTVAIRRFVVQVLCHPRLRADGDCFVSLTVTGVCYGSYRSGSASTPG